MIRWYKLVFVVLLLPLTNALAQEDALKQQIKAQLNATDKSKIEKAEKYYKNAADEIKLADEKESSDPKKTLKYRINGSKYFGKANKTAYTVYKRDLERFFNNIDPVKAKKAELKMDQAELLMKEARKKREASLRVNVLESAYALLEKANKYESRAIKNLLDVYQLFIGNSQTVGDEIVVANNTQSETNDISESNNNQVVNEEQKDETDELNSGSAKETSSDKVINTLEPIKIQGSKGAFFLLQVAASKSPIPVAGLTQTYSEDIVDEKFDEWYKYFVNKKFDTFDEANAFKSSMKARGIFVVAFKNGQKVSFEEAMKKDEPIKETVVENKAVDETINEVASSETVYRLEVGISTRPLSASEVSNFKNGGKPVMSVDRGGWFSYTIGDFNSEVEVLNFKRLKGLSDAVVLKFVNGKVVD